MSNITINSNLDHLSLQDCIVDELQWDNGNLILYFESIDVLPSHPLNSNDMAKCAEDSQLIFKNCKVSNIIRYDSTNQTKADDEPEAVEMAFDDFIIDFEVLEVKFERALGNKKVYKIVGQCAYDYNSDFGEFTITFDAVDIEWANLEDDSWFVDFDK